MSEVETTEDRMQHPGHNDLTLTWGGRPTPFKAGDRVKTRGDIGPVRGFIVSVVHNEWFCACRDESGKQYHFNMGFLELDRSVFGESDSEIDRLERIYKAFCGVDVAAQVRMIDWLTDRLQSDWKKYT